MKIPLCFALITAILVASEGPAAARKKSQVHTKAPKEEKRDMAQIEAATRLQVFLDHASFSPGPINGHYGEFTIKALALYRDSRGEPTPAPSSKTDSAPDITGLDLASVGSAFISYTVTDADIKNTGS